MSFQNQHLDRQILGMTAEEKQNTSHKSDKTQYCAGRQNQQDCNLKTYEQFQNVLNKTMEINK